MRVKTQAMKCTTCEGTWISLLWAFRSSSWPLSNSRSSDLEWVLSLIPRPWSDEINKTTSSAKIKNAVLKSTLFSPSSACWDFIHGCNLVCKSKTHSWQWPTTAKKELYFVLRLQILSWPLFKGFHSHTRQHRSYCSFMILKLMGV